MSKTDSFKTNTSMKLVYKMWQILTWIPFQNMVVLILKENDRVTLKPTLRTFGPKILRARVKIRKIEKFKANTT